MPYRINPKNKREVQVRKGGRWKRKGVAADAASAQKYLAKLKSEEEKERGYAES